MFSTFFIGALYFEQVLGYSPIKTGLAFLPAGRGMAVMSAGHHRPAGQPLRSSPSCTRPWSSPPRAAPVRVCRTARRLFSADLLRVPHARLGAGASFMPLLQIAMSEIPNEDAGLGSGIVNVSQQLAGAIGLAVLSTIAANHSKSWLRGATTYRRLDHGYQLACSSPAASSSGCSRADPPAHQGVSRRAGGPHHPEHAEPRDPGAPGSLVLEPGGADDRAEGTGPRPRSWLPHW